MPITWCLADPKLGEREVCLDLLTIAVETGLLAPGATVLADKGLAGHDIEAQIAALGVRMLRPDRRDEQRRHGNLGGVRQWISLAAVIWHNWATGAPDKRSLTAYDH